MGAPAATSSVMLKVHESPACPAGSRLAPVTVNWEGVVLAGGGGSFRGRNAAIEPGPQKSGAGTLEPSTMTTSNTSVKLTSVAAAVGLVLVSVNSRFT